jgi:uncharacterized phage-like protein YoqJ
MISKQAAIMYDTYQEGVKMNGSACAIIGQSPNHFSFGFDEDNINCAELKLTMLNEIVKLIDSGTKEFNSGMALGVDILDAEIVLSLREQGNQIRLICVLPCETQADKWSVNNRDRYFTILEKADDEHYISRHHTETCMKGRNKYLVDHVNILLAVYDDRPWGGVAQTVGYAHKQGKPILIINPESLKVTPYMVVIRGRQAQTDADT